MKLFRYNDWITESKLELLLEANMQFSKDFLATVAKVKSPLSEKILKLYKNDVDVDTNYIDLSDKENYLNFKSDKRVETSCIITNSGSIYDNLSKRLFPSLPTNYEYYINYRQPARIVKKLESDDDRLPDSLKSEIERGNSLYHIKWNYDGGDFDVIIGGNGILKGQMGVKPQEIRVGSLIQTLLKKSGEEVSGPELEDFVIKFNNEVRSIKENILKDFEIVKGDDIKTYYLSKNYYSDDHTLGGSCMRYSRCQPYLNIYSENPNQVSLVILRSDEDNSKIKGRALLWTGAQYNDSKYSDKPFMDRIYVNNSKDEELFKKFAIKNGFVYKESQNYSKNGFMFDGEITSISLIEVKLENSDVAGGNFNYYPYIDTLTFYNPHKKRLSNESCDDCYTLDETDGTNGQDEACSTCDGENYIQCGYCDGAGERDCPDCDGYCEVDCSNCDGSGEEDCSTCDGSGEASEGEDCSNCGSSGKMECTECEGSGKEGCSRCGSDGTIECYECEGNGRVCCPDC